MLRLTRSVLLHLLCLTQLIDPAVTAPAEVFLDSANKYGPDGPWNYLTLEIGSGPPSKVDFYPTFGVNAQESRVFRSDICNQTGACLQPTPGYYDASSQSARISDQNITGNYSRAFGGGFVTDITGTGYRWTDSVNTGNPSATSGDDLSLWVFPNATETRGFHSWVPVSLLSLEPNVSASKALMTGSGRNATQNTLLSIYTNNTDSSISLSLHLGAAGFNQSGSLVLGGFNQSRLIEKPAGFGPIGSVGLQSLSFGTAKGGSPWQNESGIPANFLAGSQSSSQVYISPQLPYISLPQSVCNSMADHLPLTYDPALQLYLWNTSDPMYTSIIQSPSYLNFTFSDQHRTSIRVPFAALSLNLTAPLKPSPTPYFPCDGQDATDTLHLGRAFLQSAFLIQSWEMTSFLYLAQAPGPVSVPGSSSNALLPLSADGSNAGPAVDAPKWEDTWAGILTPLPDTAPANHGRKLSGGAVAGIVIGSVVTAVGVALLIFFGRRAWNQTRRAGSVQSAGFGNMLEGKRRPLVLQEIGPSERRFEADSEPSSRGAASYGSSEVHELCNNERVELEG